MIVEVNDDGALSYLANIKSIEIINDLLICTENNGRKICFILSKNLKVNIAFC